MGYIQKVRNKFYNDFTATTLKFLILLVAVALIFLALTINNKLLLAAILAYEVLP